MTAGGVVAAGAALTAGGAGLAAGAAGGAARGGSALVGGVASAFRSGGLSVEAGASAAASPLRMAAQTAKESGIPSEAGSADAPSWVRRMKRAQTIRHGISSATQTIRSSDHGGGGSSVDLSNPDR